MANSSIDPTQIDTLIHARWVVPVTDAMPDQVLPDHSIAIHQGTITAVLPTTEAKQRYSSDNQIELSERAVIPGLIKAHTHAAMGLFRGMADDRPLLRLETNADGTVIFAGGKIMTASPCITCRSTILSNS